MSTPWIILRAHSDIINDIHLWFIVTRGILYIDIYVFIYIIIILITTYINIYLFFSFVKIMEIIQRIALLNINITSKCWEKRLLFQWTHSNFSAFLNPNQFRFWNEFNSSGDMPNGEQEQKHSELHFANLFLNI